MNIVFIIAEAGVNHNGRIEIAFDLIDAASRSGADAIKFQTFKADKMASRYAEKANYQKKNTKETESQLGMLKRYELDEENHKELIKYCKKLNIQFISSPFDLDSIDLLNRLSLKILKIPSGEITNLPYLKKIGTLNKELIVSTGMADLGEIEDAIDILVNSGTPISKITVMHCNTEYPTPYSDVNLNAMLTIKAAFSGIKVGYSDHTLGIEIALAAVALGASVIEKHFTMDRKMKGPDHKASLEPDELKAMVKAIRNIEMAMGSGIKKPSESEKINIPIARKSIVAACNIKRGDQFTLENITVKRPGTGISPMQYEKLLGKRASKDFYPDELILI